MDKIVYFSGLLRENGIPVSISLTSANTNDQMEVLPAVNKLKIKTVGSRLIADRGYVSNKLKLQLKKRKIKFIYHYKKNQKNKIQNLKSHCLKKDILWKMFSLGFKI